MQTPCSRQSVPARMPRNSVGPPANRRRDEELLAAYVETGSRDAFEELLRRYEGELYGYLRHFLGDAQLAEDAFQNTFLQVHLKCRQFEPDRRLRPWLYKIATNQAVDLLRQNRRHKAASFRRRQRRRHGSTALARPAGCQGRRSRRTVETARGA